MNLKILAAFFFLISAFTAKAQDDQGNEMDGIMKYMKQAMLFSKTLPQEKVYLHFDNTGYFMGETIWFKAYVVRADYGVATNKSKVLYVELVNPSGDVVQKRKLKIENGIANGDIKLDSIFGAGFYEVRAYTRYMTNWGGGGIFSRTFPVFKKPKVEGDYSKMEMDDYGYKKRLPNLRSDNVHSYQEEETQQEANSGNLRVRFYPEGGKLIEGLKSKVAFTVTDKQGRPIDMGGALLNENKDIIDAVNTQREGRGVFFVNPNTAPKYLRLSSENGKQYDFKLPTPELMGVALTMNTLDDEIIPVLLQSSKDIQGRLLGYTIMHNGRIIQADTLIAEPAVELELNRASMPAGVNQFTVFTSDGHIQAERMFFICPTSKEEDSIRVTSTTAFPKPCGRIKLDIQTIPNAKLSLSAIDATTMVNGAEGNAQTYMLLSSELKGYISDPGYYFESDDKQHRQAADMLMMVQGWKRYDWKMMSSEDQCGNPFNQPCEDQLYLYGKLKQKSKKYPVDGVWMEVHLYNQKGYHYDGTAKTDSLGNYTFAVPDTLQGEWNLLMNTGITGKDGYWKDVNYYVGIDRHFSPAKRLLSPLETEPLAMLRPNLFNDQKTKKATAESNEYIPINKKEFILPTVTVKAKRKSIFENARAAWASEKTGQIYASIYYNADEDADKFADQGIDVPTVYAWLASRNPFFAGEDMTSGSLTEAETGLNLNASVFDDMHNNASSDMNGTTNTQANEMENDASESNSEYFQSTDRQPRIFSDGLAYKNRPIVWVLDNDYAAISNFRRKINPDFFQVLRPTSQDLPISIDEIKSAYISESPSAFRGCLICPEVEGANPVTIFLYSHLKGSFKNKGVRTTHFEGYNQASTFETEDYSTLPPVEDFRRTLFWAPDITTDKNGHAAVEFWNNSSCKEMHISCEGMTKNGKILVNE